MIIPFNFRRNLPFLFCVSILIVTAILFYEWQWFNCPEIRNDRGFVPSKSRIHDLNASLAKRRNPISGEELLRAFAGVKMFLMFVGHPRSGHSLIGSLLDAHPQVVITHEYNAMQRFEELRAEIPDISSKILKYRMFSELFILSQNQALFEVRSPKQLNKLVHSGYNYHVPGAWQGTYMESIQVIGDKKGDWTADQGAARIFRFIEEMENVFGIPIKLIHVERNPFDNIATATLRTLKERDKVRESEEQINNRLVLDQKIEHFFRRAYTCNETTKRFGDSVLTFKSHEMIERPRETLQKLCYHLEVTCYPEYVEACVKILYESPAVTRNLVVWTDKQKERVLKRIKDYSFLKDYNFDDI